MSGGYGVIEFLCAKVGMHFHKSAFAQRADVTPKRPWVDACFACAQFRKRPSKVLTSFFVARHRLPWHHVMVDFEGPITPADRDGARYILTYTCLLCGGALLEIAESLTHSQARRSFLACVPNRPVPDGRRGIPA